MFRKKIRHKPKPRQKIRTYSQRVRRFSDKEMVSDNARGTIKRFAVQNAGGKSFFEKVLSLSKAISSFQTVEKPYQTIFASWGNRTASEIISQKTLYAIESTGEKTTKVEGCMDAATALTAAARALASLENIKAKVFFARWKTHSGVRVQVGSESRFFPGGSRMKNVKGLIAKKIEKAKEDGVYAEGFGPRAIGLKMLSDFHKYAEKSQE